MTKHKENFLGSKIKNVIDGKVGFINQILTKKQLNKSVREA